MRHGQQQVPLGFKGGRGVGRLCVSHGGAPFRPHFKGTCCGEGSWPTVISCCTFGFTLKTCSFLAAPSQYWAWLEPQSWAIPAPYRTLLRASLCPEALYQPIEAVAEQLLPSHLQLSVLLHGLQAPQLDLIPLPFILHRFVLQWISSQRTWIDARDTQGGGL